MNPHLTEIAFTRSLSRKTSALRRAAAGSVSEPDLDKPMTDILAEEDPSTPSSDL